MKKLTILAAIAAAFCAVALADFSTADFKTVQVAAPAQVEADTAVTNTFDVSGYVGLGEILADYAAPATSAVFKVTLEGTNVVDGGWTVISTGTATGAESGLLRVPFSSIYLPPTLRVILSAGGTNATVSAVFISR